LRWGAAADPVSHVDRTKASAPDAETLGDKKATEVRSTHGFFMASDVLSDLERRQKTVREFALNHIHRTT
jgi:hypothetical protein